MISQSAVFNRFSASRHKNRKSAKIFLLWQ